MSIDLTSMSEKILEESTIADGVDIDYAGVLDPVPTEPTVVIPIPNKDENGLRERDTIEQYKELQSKWLHTLDTIDMMLDNGQYESLSYVDITISNERAVSRTFGNIIHGVGNILGHMFNLVGTTLFHGWRDFKRSELTAYIDSNVTLLGRIERLTYGASSRYNELIRMGFELDVPKGMEGNYAPAINSLRQYLESVDMVNRVAVLRSICEDIADSIRSGSKETDKFIDTQNRIFSSHESQKLFLATGKIFTESKRARVPIQDMYEQGFDIVYDVKETMAMDKYMRDVASVHATMESIGSTLREIANYKDGIPPARLKALSAFTRTIADTFFQYATAVNDLNRVNHNLTMCIMGMRKVLKI